MAKRPDELVDPLVIEIEDEFSRLPAEERQRLAEEWIDSLLAREPIAVSVSGARMVAEARADFGW